VTRNRIKAHTLQSDFNLAPEPWRSLLLSSFSEIANSPFFAAMIAGTLPIDVLKYGLINIYPLVESFPKYLSACLCRLPVNGCGAVEQARIWMTENIKAERRHALWFREFGVGFGVPERLFESSFEPDPEINRLNFYLQEVSETRPIWECLAAISVAVEGATGVWTKLARAGIRECARRAHLKTSKRTFLWIDVHGRYDDRHPIEAFRIMQDLMKTEIEDRRALQAARKALSLYSLAAQKSFAKGLGSPAQGKLKRI
jgi:pyrroloquinoline quinone (PQQ) biosynthesis protein C